MPDDPQLLCHLRLPPIFDRRCIHTFYCQIRTGISHWSHQLLNSSLHEIDDAKISIRPIVVTLSNLLCSRECLWLHSDILFRVFLGTNANMEDHFWVSHNHFNYSDHQFYVLLSLRYPKVVHN